MKQRYKPSKFNAQIETSDNNILILIQFSGSLIKIGKSVYSILESFITREKIIGKFIKN
ncbi:MAG: hypothetical protein FWD66_04685 [Paludibacter sp.]|nr:hypothetical protein [Paludibacter sp.]